MIKESIVAMMAVVCFGGARVGYTASEDNFYKG